MSDNTLDIETSVEELAESGSPGSLDSSDSVDSSVRYAAYANRLRVSILVVESEVYQRT